MRYKHLLVPVLLLAVAGVAAGQTPDLTNVTHLLSRATFGVRPADVAAVQKTGIAKWVDQQLQPDRIDDSAVDARLARFQSLQMSIPELAETYAPRKQQADSLRARMYSPQRLLAELVSAKLVRAADSNRQLEEVMTDFWFNHFNVFFANGPVRYLVADYEKNAIRPHVFGKFYDLLYATATHPAMLLYLNNAKSTARGLNENYARELMELHTLGVDAGYTQQDVIQVARAFTGWTVVPPRRIGDSMEMADEQHGFRFAPFLHDRGEKIVLGHKLAAGRGMEDGEDVLHMLASSPATAHHIARQLIQHFVTDDPPQDFVNELAAVFLKTGGDLKAVTRALFTSPHFYDAKYYRAKVKTPFELIASALRVTDADFTASPQLLQTLRSLGELPYMEQAPTGYPAASADWVNSGAMLNRMNFAIALAAGGARGVRVGIEDTDVATMLADVLPGVDVSARRTQIEKDAGSDLRRALGFALGSPEFQLK